MFSIGSASGNIPANFQRPLSRLAGGLRVCEVDESGCVPELVVENPLDSGAALRRRGARRREAEPHSERQRHRRGEVDAADPRLLRRAGALVAAVGVLRRGKPRFACRASAPEGRGAGRSRSRGEFHRARSGTRFTSARWSCASPHPPGASSDLYRARAGDLRALEDAFPAQPGQCGAILGIGSDLCLDAVSRPDAFARLWPKLRAGYLLDALERLDGKPTTVTELEAFVADVGHSLVSRQPSVGLGEDLRLRSDRVIGSGLVLGDETIQLSAFRSDDGGRRAFGRIARPSTT
jgi:hypothetical protein